jgi:hypothetical protein
MSRKAFIILAGIALLFILMLLTGIVLIPVTGSDVLCYIATFGFLIDIVILVIWFLVAELWKE